MGLRVLIIHTWDPIVPELEREKLLSKNNYHDVTYTKFKKDIKNQSRWKRRKPLSMFCMGIRSIRNIMTIPLLAEG